MVEEPVRVRAQVFVDDVWGRFLNKLPLSAVHAVRGQFATLPVPSRIVEQQSVLTKDCLRYSVLALVVEVALLMVGEEAVGSSYSDVEYHIKLEHRKK